MAKLDIYRKFTIALAVTVLVSIGWIGYEIYFKSTDVFNERWQYAWIIPAFWHVLSFSLLCVISYLWAPSQNSMRYNPYLLVNFNLDNTQVLLFHLAFHCSRCAE
jgi:hypothetical protein